MPPILKMLKGFKAKTHLHKFLQKSTLLLALGITTTALPMAPAYAKVTSADFSELVSQVTQGVARVNVTKNVSEEELAQAQTAELLKKFFGDRVNIPDSQVSPVEKAFGTAFFITQDGYMLTNNHVVEGADSITVTLNDRRELDATLVGSDERSDVAVLKVTGSSFPALPVGDSSQLKVGEPVLAIGSPFGFDYSASSGIVSATSRNFSRQTSVPFIQTDVAINPGNSGGPLFNQEGEVIGINSRIFSDTGSYLGLSFSIPVNEAMEIYEQIKTGGKVERAYFGAFPQDIDRNLAEVYGLDRPIGALLTRVTPDSPASKAGLKSGDVILKYNDTDILSSDDLVNKLYRAKPGDQFKLLLQRSGKQRIATGKFEQVPTGVESSATDNFEHPQKIKLGINLRELLPTEKLEMRNAGIDGGVLIVDVNPTGRAARAGLQAGDLVTNLHQNPTLSINDFAAAVQGLPETGVVTVEVIRSRIPVIIGLRID
ncbi:trypsin-like peptidase domain-containing protein [Psychrobacter sp. HD31]|uniref:trypsin-like peptidase domain-containing protein n=1 Tax=Psychrobacter sp. HD31 TaxID=3112003 RepID=UPI003DA39B09